MGEGRRGRGPAAARQVEVEVRAVPWPLPASRVCPGARRYCRRSSVSDLENAITTSSAPWSMECGGSWLSWLLTTPA